MNPQFRARLDELHARLDAEEAQRQHIADNRYVPWKHPNHEQPCLKVSDADISAASRRMHELLVEHEQCPWLNRQSEFRRLHNDEFGAELGAIYEADVAKRSAAILRVLLDFTRLHGVRFASVSKQDFYCFENFTGSTWAGSSSPVAWTIISRLDRHKDEFTHVGHKRFDSGTGNGPQRQIAFVREMANTRSWGTPALRDEHWGIYDLRGETPVRVWHTPLALRETYTDYVRTHYSDDVDLNAYLMACGKNINIPGWKRCPYRGSERFCGIVELDLENETCLV